MPGQPGAVYLAGGGRDEAGVVTLLERFVQDAAAARGEALDAPRIHALLVLEVDDNEGVERFRRALRLAGADVALHWIEEGATFDSTAVEDADGIFVGG